MVPLLVPEQPRALPRQLRPADQPQADRVLDVAADVGDRVGHAHDTALERHRHELGRTVARLGPHLRFQQREALVAVRREDLVVHLAVVAEDPVERLEAEVPALALALHRVEEAHALDVVVELADPVLDAQLREEPLAVVAEGGVADVVPEGDRLDQVLVQAQEAADRAADLGDQLHVQHPVGDVVVADEVEDLGLVDVARVGPRVEDAVHVDREGLAVALVQGLLAGAAQRRRVARGVRRQPPVFPQVERLADRPQHALVRCHGFRSASP